MDRHSIEASFRDLHYSLAANVYWPPSFTTFTTYPAVELIDPRVLNIYMWTGSLSTLLLASFEDLFFEPYPDFLSLIRGAAEQSEHSQCGTDIGGLKVVNACKTEYGSA